MFPSTAEGPHPPQATSPADAAISYSRSSRAPAIYTGSYSDSFTRFSTEAHARNSLDDWVKTLRAPPPIVTNLHPAGAAPYVTDLMVGFENHKLISALPGLNLLQHDALSKGFESTHFSFPRDFDGFAFGGVSNTSFDFGTEGRLSPLPLSPSPTANFLCPGSHCHRGPTPDLLTPESSPSTGRSRNILLTPDSGGCPGIGLPPQTDSSSPHSPVNRFQHHSTGTTPSFLVLSLDDHSDTRTPIDREPCADRGAGNFTASDSLGLSHGTGETQDLSLPPLDMGSDLIGIDLSTSSNSGYNIEIRCSTPESIPVPVETQAGDQSCPSPCFFSPQQLQALGIEYHSGSGGANTSNQAQASLTSPIAIAGPHTFNWEISGFPSHNPPDPAPRFHYHYRNRCLSTSALPLSTSPRITATRFHPPPISPAVGGTGAVQVHVPVRTHGDIPSSAIVNPKGVSERMLKAARANRTREQRFQCDICYDWQTSKQNLENHRLSRHLGVKRFVCTVPGCSKKYGHSRGLNRHLDSKHPGFRQTNSRAGRSPAKRAHDCIDDRF